MYPKEKGFEKLFCFFFVSIEFLLCISAVQFDKAGRPYHFLYYTAKQNYFDVLHVKLFSFVFRFVRL